MKFIYTLFFLFLSVIGIASAPTLPSHSLGFNAIDGGYFNLGWQAGNGARRVIVCKAGSAPTFVPQNGIDYNANTAFGQGQEVAPGEFIIFDHFSTSFFLTDLNPATTYYFKIFDYNGSGATTEYLTSSFLSGSSTTSATPTSQTTNATFTSITTNSVIVNWVNGNGLRRLIVVREGSPVTADPVSGTQYNVSSVFGNGATIGAGNFTVYASTGTGTAITNLKQGTQYFFSFYEFNGNAQPQYKTPAYTTSVTTRSIPTIASTGLSITKTDGKELYLDWTKGNGQRRIIIAKQGSDVSSVPVNGTDYTANEVFGLGQQLGAGEYVVYDDNFNAATISGLNPATTYYFKIFEYDGTGSNTIYLVSSFASVNGSTAITPTAQAQWLAASNITSTSFRLNITPGNGRARIIIGRKAAAVTIAPVNFTGYSANTNFGTGHDFGNGNFAVANTTEPIASINGLQPNTTYHFAIYEFNGFNQPLYLAPAAVTSVTTLGVLPVKLSSWEATAANGKVKLQWKTSTEINASHFVIERSSDGINFTPVATVNAMGNSQAGVNYNSEDNAPLTGKSYYRLKMVDKDGKSEYSSVRIVLLSTNSAVRIVGNPVQNSLQVIATMNNNSKAEWEIINKAGQVVKRGSLLQGRTDINVSALATGSYWLRTAIGPEMETIAFIKQ